MYYNLGSVTTVSVIPHARMLLIQQHTCYGFLNSSQRAPLPTSLPASPDRNPLVV
ncbi:hypothetical protein EI94DRAFT_1738426, partial [Lactarius quietus]